jgi:hypothetical protein
MRRAFVSAFLPVVLFALEPVNLIKNAGFEKDSELWLMRSEAEVEYDSTIINRHDPDSAYIDEYCGSIDSRKEPAPGLPELYDAVGYLYQIITLPKPLKDLDSLELFHMCLFRKASKYSTWSYGANLYFVRPSDSTLINVCYFWLAPGSTPAPDEPHYKRFPDTIPDKGVWWSLRCDLKADLIEEKRLSGDIELDTFMLFGCGVNHNGFWYGQKVFFDGVRLTGYADYDVGVEEILSDTTGTPYIPVARIKNFGRELADSFLVIAEMFNGKDTLYADTLSWSLEADTDDTVTFAEWPPSLQCEMPGLILCTLCVHTVMEPDESDEDDGKLKQLILGGVAEPVTPVTRLITLDVRSLTHPLHVTYSLPYGEHGTLTLYDTAGRRIERMTVKGSGVVDFNSSLPSSVYLVRLEAGELTVTKKAVVLK